MRKNCPRCHQANPHWAKFCQFCGMAFVQDVTPLTTASTTQFNYKPKKCENATCHALMDSSALRCPYCNSLQLKPHLADVVAARITNMMLGITIFSFFLETVFSQSILERYCVLNLYTFVLLNEQSNLQSIFYAFLALSSFFVTLFIGQLITKGQNIGFETLQIHIFEKNNNNSEISEIITFKKFRAKKAILWAIIETIDTWTFFTLSLLTYLLAILFMRDSKTIFISDRAVGGILVDKKKLDSVKEMNVTLSHSKMLT